MGSEWKKRPSRAINCGRLPVSNNTDPRGDLTWVSQMGKGELSRCVVSARGNRSCHGREEGTRICRTSSLTRVTLGELHAVVYKLCVSIEGGGACRNKRRHARRAQLNQFGNRSGVESRVRCVQRDVLPRKTGATQNLCPEYFNTAGNEEVAIPQGNHFDLILDSDLGVGRVAIDVFFVNPGVVKYPWSRCLIQ